MDPQIRPIHTAAGAAPRPPFQGCLADLIAVRDIAAHWRSGGVVSIEDQIQFVRSALAVLEAINQDMDIGAPNAARGAT